MERNGFTIGRRPAEDHDNVALLAEGLHGAGFRVRPRETNMVPVDTPGTEDVVARAARGGVLVTAPGPGVVRLVTHLDVGRQACLRAVEVLTAVIGGGRRRASGTAAGEHTQSTGKGAK
ncbi:hypothetical protein [Streptomyces sp. URMC 123]|uniref:hypothetical protein n=1 Tax=Streptomyces sp. URMC 123 TaxID=3423403 RepID=UPI003F1B40E9